MNLAGQLGMVIEKYFMSIALIQIAISAGNNKQSVPLQPPDIAAASCCKGILNSFQQLS